MTFQVDYTANGSIVVFPFPFAIPSKAALEVRVNNVVQDVGFHITGAGSNDGGTVVFGNAPAEGLSISLRHLGAITITSQDASAGHLSNKLVAGSGITLETLTEEGGVQRLRITGTDTVDAYTKQEVQDRDNAVIALIRDLSGVTNVGAAQTKLDVYDKATVASLIASAQPDLSNVLRRTVSSVIDAGFWSKPVALSVVGGIATPDPLVGNVFTLQLNAATTLGFPSGMTGRAGMMLVVAKQDATGGRTLNLAAGYHLSAGKWSTTANAVNLLWITSDGSGAALDVVIAQRGE